MKDFGIKDYNDPVSIWWWEGNKGVAHTKLAWKLSKQPHQDNVGMLQARVRCKNPALCELRMSPAPTTNLLSQPFKIQRGTEARILMNDNKQLVSINSILTHIFRIDDVLQMMRKDKITYFPFLELFGPAVVGKNKWKTKWRQHPFGQCLTVSDEAFVILCYENFKLVWIEQYWQESTAISNKVCVIFVLWSILWCFIRNGCFVGSK